MKTEKTIDWMGAWTLFGGAIVSSFVGMGMVFVMTLLGNGFIYSWWASYMCAIIIWWVMIRGINLDKPKDKLKEKKETAFRKLRKDFQIRWNREKEEILNKLNGGKTNG